MIKNFFKGEELSEKRIFAHIISHTHWDREWYLSSEYTSEWLPEFFNRLFEILEKDNDYAFVLDGQTAMIDDYFDELIKRGEDILVYKGKIKKYVREKRLFIGPYYVQLDWNLVNDETLIRNLKIGNKISMEFGRVMKIGWLMDNFGQISQTIQIHKGFGINGIYVWRGVIMNPEKMRSEFMWESKDGTKLPSVYLIDSYRNAMRLAEYKSILKERIYDEVEKLKPFASSPNVLLMNGYDQEIVPDYYSPYIKNGKLDTDEIKIVQSNPENYIKEIAKYKSKMDIIKGPLYSGKFIAVFPGVLSCRVYLKLQSYRCQKLLEIYAESISTILWSIGGEYGGDLLEILWKKLLKCFSHDNISGVCTDDVCSNMEKVFSQVEKTTNGLIENKIRKIAGLIDTSSSNKNEVFILFNPCAYKRNEVVSINGRSRLIKSIPPLGYKVVYDDNIYEENESVRVKGNSIENKKLIVDILSNGSFNLTDKISGRIYESLGIIEDSGDAGDEYDYSYPDEDRVITSRKLKAEIEFIEISKARAVVKIKIILKIPEALTGNRKMRRTDVRELPVVTFLTVDSGSSSVSLKTEIKNTVKDHRMRVLFPTGIDTEYSFAGSAFDIVKNPVYIKDYSDTDIPEEVKKVIIGAREAKPATIFPMNEFVDISDKDGGVALLSRGLREYQIIPEKKTIALTLFRSVGWIAREINTRIGDAGPEIMVPEAQCLRQMAFEYAVYVHKWDVNRGGVQQKADAFNNKLMIIKTVSHKGSLKSSQGFMEVHDKDRVLRVTSIKRSDDRKAIILRCYNPSEKKVCGKIISDFVVEKAQYVNFLEEARKVIKDNDGRSVGIVVKPGQIVTIRLEIKRKRTGSFPVYPAEIIRVEAKEDFSKYESIPLITEEDILNEEKRAGELKKDSKSDDPMILRKALEAELSAKLIQKQFIKKYIRKLGYQINNARVKARVYNYINKYINKKC